MPRARTKGDRIQIQLPLEIDADVRSHAEARGESPAAFVENVVVSSRSEGWVYPIGTKPEVVKMPALQRPTMTVDVSNPADPACTHPKAKIQVTSSAGLHRCACGAVRGVDGEWR